MNKVVIAKGENALDQIFNELEVKKTLRNIEDILIKPNLRAASANHYVKCSITNPLIVKSLAEKLLDLGKCVTIAECTSSKHITKKAFKNSGIKLLERKGVTVLNLNLCESTNIKANGSVLKNIEVPLPIADSDFIISLPVMKTHIQTTVSLSMKNMIGAMSEIEPSRMHCAGLHQAIADINKVIKPDLCIIDATRAMEGSGPVRGREVVLNTLVGGYDAVSVDSIGAKIMGFDPYTIEHIVFAEKSGVGKIKPDCLVGKIDMKKFIRPREDGARFIDFYSLKWFNILMSNKVIHSLAYDYFYYFWKKLRNMT